MKIYRLAQKKKKMQKPCFTAVRKKKSLIIGSA